MEGISSMLKPIIDSGNHYSFISYLSACSELKTFQNKGEDNILPVVNSLLNEQSSRRQGLYLLQTYLPQCKKSILGENIVSWCHSCMKADTDLSYEILCSLLKVSWEFPDARKLIAQNFIGKLIDRIINATKENDKSIFPLLKVLHVCLIHYGKISCIQKDALDSALLRIIEGNNDLEILWAGKCFAWILPSGTVEAALQGWVTKHLSTLHTLQSLLGELFFNVNEIEGLQPSVPGNPVKLKLPKVKEASGMVKFQRLGQQFSNLSRYLQCSLLMGMNFNRKVAVEAVLGVVGRALSVTIPVLNARPSYEASALVTQLPFIHIAALNTLESLIICGGSNLLPYSIVIVKNIVLVLKLTEPKNYSYGQSKPYEILRKSCYSCLKAWLRVPGSCISFSPLQLKQIIDALISDIRYVKPTVQLNVEVRGGRKKRNFGNKNKAPVAANIDNSLSDQVSPVDETVNRDHCLSALAIIPILNQAASTLMAPSDVKKLQEAIVKTAYEIFRSVKLFKCITENRRNLGDEHGWLLPLPYSNEECRIGLLNGLLGVCVSTNPKFPPPLQYAQSILNYSQYDSSLKVREVSLTALSSLNHIMRPSYPSFDFPLEVSSGLSDLNINQEFASHDVNMTDKNSPPTVKLQEDDECVKPSEDFHCGIEIKEISTGIADTSDDPVEYIVEEFVESRAEFSQQRSFPSVKVIETHIEIESSSDEDVVIVENPTSPVNVCNKRNVFCGSDDTKVVKRVRTLSVDVDAIVLNDKEMSDSEKIRSPQVKATEGEMDLDDDADDQADEMISSFVDSIED